MRMNVPYSEIGNKVVYIGIDVHINSYAVTAIKEGVVVKRCSIKADGRLLVKLLNDNFPNDEKHSVYEAGFSGFVLHRILESSGINNIIVNPASVAVVKGNRVKTDKIDSKKLAVYLSKGLLKGIRIPSIEEEQSRILNRSREQFARQRVRIMNQIRRRLVHFGYLLEYKGVLRIADVKELVESLHESSLKTVLQIFLKTWVHTEASLKEIDKLLKMQSESCPYQKTYIAAPGIGRVASRILANELGDMRQFKNEKALYSFVGLTPSEHSSGERITRGHITRQGNPLIRKVLVESAWVAIRKDRALRDYYSRLSVRAGSKRAIVAVARKLIGKIRAAFRNKELYVIALEKKAA